MPEVKLEGMKFTVKAIPEIESCGKHSATVYINMSK
jgi:hypothetical protein